MEETRGFIEALRRQAKKGSSAYAAVILLMEQPLGAETLHDDPLFGSLCSHYDLKEKSIRPLFEHSSANGINGHSDLGAQVLARRPWIPPLEANDILSGVDTLVQALDAWYQALGRNYRDPGFHEPRFRAICAPDAAIGVVGGTGS
jgi:hypothetical protein